jgi:hypothetical protein
MSSTRSCRETSSPFPDHYEETRIGGKEHPAEDLIVTANGIFRTGGVGIKMCEALAAQQEQRIKWDGRGRARSYV